eukprot:scaffold17318_cov169-Amphora_coffeaeformis.AAC.4
MSDKKKTPESKTPPPSDGALSSFSNNNNEDNHGQHNPYYDSLIRDPAKGMESVSLLTGLYGSRGERIRHVAHVGALQIPPEALSLLLPPAASAQRAAANQLPTLDSVLRPSVEMDDMTATQVRMEIVPTYDPMTGDQISSTVRTVAANEVVPKQKMNILTGDEEKDQEMDVDPERIRGGNGEEESHQQQQPQQQQGGSAPVPSPAPPASSDMGAPPPAATSSPSQPPAATSVPNPVATTATISTTSAVPNPVAAAPSSTAPASAVPNPVSTISQPTTTTVPSNNDTTTTPAAATTTPTTTASAAPPATSTSPSITTTPATTMPPAPTPSTTATPTSQPEPTPAAVEVKKEEKKEEPVVIQGLDKTPGTQWEQHKPGPADEMAPDPAAKTAKPDWFAADKVSDIERACLAEWFDGSARHRTTESYLQARNKVMQMSEELGTKFVTATLVRRSIPGDAGSLLRLHEFLTTHALINEDATNDSAPTTQALLGEAATALYWNEQKDERLMECVVEQARKRPRLSSPENESVAPALDWETVAETVGMTARQCEQRFLTLPVQDMAPPAGSVTPDVNMSDSKEETAQSQEDNKKPSATEMVEDLVSRADPALVHSVLNAALGHTSSLDQAQSAAVAGLALHEVIQEARSAQDALSRVLSHAVDLRMQKLEHRLALLDDVEGLLEAERVALELERRDLYTARCRHWFGGA